MPTQSSDYKSIVCFSVQAIGRFLPITGSRRNSVTMRRVPQHCYFGAPPTFCEYQALHGTSEDWVMQEQRARLTCRSYNILHTYLDDISTEMLCTLRNFQENLLSTPFCTRVSERIRAGTAFGFANWNSCPTTATNLNTSHLWGWSFGRTHTNGSSRSNSCSG